MQTNLRLQDLPNRLALSCSERVLRWWSLGLSQAAGSLSEQEQRGMRLLLCAHPLSSSPSFPRLPANRYAHSLSVSTRHFRFNHHQLLPPACTHIQLSIAPSSTPSITSAATMFSWFRSKKSSPNSTAASTQEADAASPPTIRKPQHAYRDARMSIPIAEREFYETIQARKRASLGTTSVLNGQGRGKGRSKVGGDSGESACVVVVVCMC